MFARSSLSCVCAVLTAVFAIIANSSADLKKGLVCYWPFETVTTEFTPDIISRNDLYLFEMGRTNLVPGRFGNALTFDGKRQFLALNYSTNKTLPVFASPAYSVAMWVKGPPNQSNRIVFAEGSTADRLPLFLIGTERYGSNASANVFLRKTTTPLIDNLPSATPVFDNTWQHIVWIDEEGSARLYINGVVDSADYNYLRTDIRLNNLSVGAVLRSPPVYFFRGEIDEVAIWKRALSESEIRELLKNPLSSKL